MVGNFRDELGKTFAAVGEAFPELYVVTADVSKSTRSRMFGERWPDRFYSVGIAEADAVGIAAGIASFGGPVIFTAYGVFATEKPFEQIRNCLCYPNLNVKIVATHGGISVGEDGATHQCVEDLALMRVIPGMTVVNPCDGAEMRAAVQALIDYDGPAYLRLGRSAVETVTEYESGKHTFQLGKGVTLREGKDVTIVATGMMVQLALQAAELLAAEGIDARVLDIHTVKPLDTELILKAAKETGAIVTSEEHSVIGGLGGAVAEFLSGHCPVPVIRHGVKDVFGRSGKAAEVLEAYGLTAEVLAKCARHAVEKKNGPKD